jgi:hypothetical protein
MGSVSQSRGMLPQDTCAQRVRAEDIDRMSILERRRR